MREDTGKNRSGVFPCFRLFPISSANFILTYFYTNVIFYFAEHALNESDSIFRTLFEKSGEHK